MVSKCFLASQVKGSISRGHEPVRIYLGLLDTIPQLSKKKGTKKTWDIGKIDKGVLENKTLLPTFERYNCL